MAKNSVRDFDATAANNTDIQSVDIAENCAPSGINNAIRELMADIKDVSSGTIALESPQADSLTVTGDLTVDTDTLKVDSTNNRVGIGEDVPLKELSVVGTVRVQSANGDAQGLNISSDANGDAFIDAGYSVSDLKFGINGSEHMRVSSSGSVLINTVTSTVDALTVAGNANANSLSVNGSSTTGQSYGALILAGTNGSDASLRVYNASASSTYLFVRGDGNVGIGGAGAASVKLFAQDTSATAYTLYAQNSSGSFNGGIFVAQSQRAATSAYALMQGYASTDLEFNFRGDGNAFADGSFTGGGADYAEMFEWDDANSNNEDRRGFSVVLTNGNKIRKATSDDAAADIIGIVSANPTVLGDSAWNMWDEKYNKDDFGGYVLESYTITEWTEPAVFEDVEIEAVLDEEGNEIEPARTEQRKISDEVEHSYETDKIPSDLTVPSDAVVSSVDADGNTLERRQLNSNYDDTQTYTPREERQEWDAVGMMGKLRMRSGQPTGDRWIKMRDITSDIEEWLVR